MSHFRAKHSPSMPVKVAHPAAKGTAATGREKRRGVRVNSRVPISLEWDLAGAVHRREAQTRVVGPYGCLVIVPLTLNVRQVIKVTNLVSKQSNTAVVVWCGMERADGWEMGIELVNPQMDFWGLDL